MMRPSITVPLVLLMLFGGCYRGGDGSAGTGDDDGDTGDDGGAATGADGSGDDEGSQSACADATLGVTPIRRLQASEYRNTVADLFAIAPPAAEALPTDAKYADFRTTANQLLSAGTATKYFDAARLVAEARTTTHPEWFPCAQDDDCVETFLRDEGRRIFRRPPTVDEVAHYHGLFTARIDAGDTPAEAADILLQALLVSPHFLFLTQPSGEPGERVPLDDWQVATRLSYLLWASTPDDALLDAAEAGALATPEARAEQAQRLLDDPRAVVAVDDFFMQWFQAEDISTVAKDPDLYPAVVPELTAALEEEARLYFREVFWNRGATLEELLVSPVRVRNGSLSAYYGDDLVPATQTELAVVQGEIDERSFGLLSQAGLLMTVGRNAPTQIIHRGKFVRAKLLCQHLVIPDAGTVPPLPAIDPLATTREQVQQHTGDGTCAGCHTLLNPPGFALEHFDNAGVWRDDERGLPLDTTADLGDLGIEPVDGALSLSRALADSPLVQQCAVQQMFEFAIGRVPTPDDACVADDLLASFVASGGDIQALLVDVVGSDAFAARVVPEE